MGLFWIFGYVQLGSKIGYNLPIVGTEDIQICGIYVFYIPIRDDNGGGLSYIRIYIRFWKSFLYPYSSPLSIKK